MAAKVTDKKYTQEIYQIYNDYSGYIQYIQLSLEVLLKYHPQAFGPRVIFQQNFLGQLYILYIALIIIIYIIHINIDCGGTKTILGPAGALRVPAGKILKM